MALRVCPSCSRHARDSTCPFCGAEIPHDAAPTVLPRLSRAGLVGIAASAVVVSACSSTVVAAYGLPPTDGGAEADAPVTLDAAYGGPPFDASAEAAPDASDGSADAGSD